MNQSRSIHANDDSLICIITWLFMVHSENSLFLFSGSVSASFICKCNAPSINLEIICCCCRCCCYSVNQLEMLYKFVQFINNNWFLFTVHLNMNSSARTRSRCCGKCKGKRLQYWTKNNNSNNNEMEASTFECVHTHTRTRIKWTYSTNERAYISFRFNSIHRKFRMRKRIFRVYKSLYKMIHFRFVCKSFQCYVCV